MIAELSALLAQRQGLLFFSTRQSSARKQIVASLIPVASRWTQRNRRAVRFAGAAQPRQPPAGLPERAARHRGGRCARDHCRRSGAFFAAALPARKREFKYFARHCGRWSSREQLCPLFRTNSTGNTEAPEWQPWLRLSSPVSNLCMTSAVRCTPVLRQD